MGYYRARSLPWFAPLQEQEHTLFLAVQQRRVQAISGLYVPRTAPRLRVAGAGDCFSPSSIAAISVLKKFIISPSLQPEQSFADLPDGPVIVAPTLRCASLVLLPPCLGVECLHAHAAQPACATWMIIVDGSQYVGHLCRWLGVHASTPCADVRQSNNLDKGVHGHSLFSVFDDIDHQALGLRCDNGTLHALQRGDNALDAISFHVAIK